MVRWSTCDCTEAHGLQRKVKAALLPPKPSSYHELLRAAGAERLVLAGEPSVEALATPLRCESGAVFLSGDARWFCAHGNEFTVKHIPPPRKPLTPQPAAVSIQKKKNGLRLTRRFLAKQCGCHMALPNRTSFPELPFAIGGLDAT